MNTINRQASRLVLIFTFCIALQMLVMIDGDHQFTLAPETDVSIQHIASIQEQVPLLARMSFEELAAIKARSSYDYERDFVIDPMERDKSNDVVVIASAESTEPTETTESTEPTEPHLNIALENYQSVHVVATGYYAGSESTGKAPGHPEYGITYSGLEVLRDSGAVSTIAADIDVFPLGTLLYIPGYGYGVVADIGSAVKGNVIDLYFDTIDDVYSEWGKKALDVFVIQYGEGKLTKDMFEQLQNTYKQ